MITFATPKGTTILLDDVDRDLIQYKWNNMEGYAYRQVGSRKGRTTILMHREIAARSLGRALVRGEHIDHINGNRSDNRRRNLRVATRSENMRNRPHTRVNHLALKGVRLRHDLTSRPYLSMITLSDQRFYIGYFSSPEEAAWMYDQWAIHLHGEYARLNFEYVEVEAQL
ncbi:HNH endonuclease [Mycobacteroides abscessus]|uniref:HNH endonuclease n=1 Tax=Mycobacteroides abscessus TaxID=36809 RepID=UPI000C260427